MRIIVKGKLNKRAVLSILKCSSPVLKPGGIRVKVKLSDKPKASQKKIKIRGGHLRDMINYSDRF